MQRTANTMHVLRLLTCREAELEGRAKQFHVQHAWSVRAVC